MTNDINLLVPEFREKVEQLLANCKKLGYEMRPTETLRHPLIQAKYWRQSRTTQVINSKIIELQHAGAPFLATCIENAGSQSGPHVTNSIPGFSWHQWCEAIDCHWLLNGKAIWDTQLLINGSNGYRVYAEEAAKLGLDAGMLWKKFPDAPHVQLRTIAAPYKLYSLKQIDAEMSKRFK